MPKQKPMKWPLPVAVHPTETVCYTVHVPKDRAYIGAFLGAMFLLSKPYAWADDPDHTAVEVGAVWRKIFDNLLKGDCPGRNCPPVNFIEDDMPTFRQEGCLLQTQCADGEWVTIYDPSACIVAGASQPPPGGTPEPGACLEYDVVLQANSKWQLPVAVDNGDIVTITGAAGGWSDGTINPWHCPDGNNYILGACVPGTAGFDGADPVPSKNHMRLVALTSTQGYDAFNTVIGFSGYSSPDTLTFQANDSTLGDDAGSISFHVKICKAALPPVEIGYNFGIGPATANYGENVTMQGVDAGSATCAEVFDLQITLSPCATLTFVSLADWVLRDCGDGDTLYSYRDCSGTLHTVTNAMAGRVPPVGVTFTNINLFELIGANAFTTVIKLDPA